MSDHIYLLYALPTPNSCCYVLEIISEGEYLFDSMIECFCTLFFVRLKGKLTTEANEGLQKFC